MALDEFAVSGPSCKVERPDTGAREDETGMTDVKSRDVVIRVIRVVTELR